MSTGKIIDASGTITTGGTSQVGLAADGARHFLEIHNPTLKADGVTAETEALRFNFGADCTAANSFTLAPGATATYSAEDGVCPIEAVHVLAATTGHVFIIKWA
jgi:hypothetical protein